jgi:hypothetical protein
MYLVLSLLTNVIIVVMTTNVIYSLNKGPVTYSLIGKKQKHMSSSNSQSLHLD